MVSGKPTCHFGMREVTGARLDEWRALIATAAARAMKQEMPFTGPVQVQLTFYFPRPKSHTVAQREQPYVTTRERYDVDKLSRAVLDALTTSACYGDDSQVAHLEATKYYAMPNEKPGVAITVEAL
jgi:Holliday junction resolvase RusA-like endonuclease